MNKSHKKIGMIFGLVFLLAIGSNVILIQASPDEIPSPPQPVLVKGDLIFMEKAHTEIIQDVDGTTSNDHVALYIGYDVVDGVSGIWCISAGLLEEGSGVGYVRLGYYTDENYFDHLKIGRVMTANLTQRNAAIVWAKARVGSQYQSWFGHDGLIPRPLKCANPYDPFIPTANKWYCSELVWAAYYNQGIDIDNNGWGFSPYGIPCVNMGLPILGLIPNWLEPLLPFLPDYVYENEIQIDDDINLIPWT